MKLREFWILDQFESECSSSIEAHKSDCFRVLPYNMEKIIHVREVSPELDAAISELLEVAYQHQAETTHPFKCECRTCGAIDALKKAREE
jgi:hypothetical protein